MALTPNPDILIDIMIDDKDKQSVFLLGSSSEHPPVQLSDHNQGRHGHHDKDWLWSWWSADHDKDWSDFPKDGRRQTLAEYEKSLIQDYKRRSQQNLNLT